MTEFGKYSPRVLRRLLMEGEHPDLERLRFMATEHGPACHVALMAQCQESADAIRETLAEMPPTDVPMHVALDRAMEEAAAAADEAFNKALVAAFRFFLMMDKCKCQDCKNNRQRANAMWQ